MSSVITATAENFKDVVLGETASPVLVDFWAEWCGPCRALSPVLDELAEEMGDKGKVVKLNVTDHSDLAKEYGVSGIPTLIFFKNGETAKTFVGTQSKDQLKKIFDDLQ